MIVHLHLTDDHLKLIKFIGFDESEDDVIKIDKRAMLSVRTHILDDVAMVLGLLDKAIPSTDEDPDGRAYPDEVEKHMLDTYNYVSENLYYIETLIHQRCTEGTPAGHYKAKDNELIWEKVED